MRELRGRRMPLEIISQKLLPFRG